MNDVFCALVCGACMKRLGFKLKEELRFAKLLCTPQSMAQLYRCAVAAAEEDNSFTDYHLLLSDNVSETHAVLKCKLPRKGEVDCARDIACSSCDPLLSLQTLLMAPKASVLADLPNKLLLVNDGKVGTGVVFACVSLLWPDVQQASCLWLDAKDRAMLVLTPRAHKERLAQLDEAELLQLFEDLRAVLERHPGTARCVTKMVVNQGRCQNHPHLHWKLYLERAAFERFVAGLSEEQQRDRRRVMDAVKAARQAGQLGRKG